MPDSSPQQLPESDEALAARAAQGDQAAFVALYDRHFHEVYDFLARLLLSRRRAATALLSTFVRFRRRLSEEHGRGSPRLAILAAAYQAAMEEGPSAADVAASGDEEEQLRTFAQLDPDRLASPGEAVQAQEEALIVWQGAAGVDRTEYALLDLHLRRGLNAAQAGRVLAMGRFKVGGMISHLKTAAEEAFTSLLVLKFGRGQCAELDQLAASMEEAALPSESRRLVSGHIAACATCSETRKRLVPPLNVLAALLPVPPAPGVKDAVLQDLLSYTAVQAGTAVAAAAAREAAPRPAPMSPPPQRPRIPPAIGGSAGGPVFPLLIGAAVALAIPVAALLVWLAVLSGGGDSSASVEPTPTPLGGAALEGCGSAGPGTPVLGTCTPTPTRTPTRTATSAPAATTTATKPSPTATATASPAATAPPVATATKTPVVGETPTGTVETATPTPSPGPHTTPSAASSPSPAHSPSPGASPSPH